MTREEAIDAILLDHYRATFQEGDRVRVHLSDGEFLDGVLLKMDGVLLKKTEDTYYGGKRLLSEVLVTIPGTGSARSMQFFWWRLERLAAAEEPYDE